MALSDDEESIARLEFARMTEDQLRRELLILRNLVSSLEERQVLNEGRIGQMEDKHVRWQMGQVDERRRGDTEQRQLNRQLLAQVETLTAKVERLEAARTRTPRQPRPAKPEPDVKQVVAHAEGYVEGTRARLSGNVGVVRQLRRPDPA